MKYINRKYHHRHGESLAEEKKRLIGLAMKLGLIEIKHFPHETGKMAGFSDQFKTHLTSFLQGMSAKGKSRFDENTMLDVVLDYVKKYPKCDADSMNIFVQATKKENVIDLRRICELMVSFMISLNDEGVAYQ